MTDKPKARLKDVARRAGVSSTTASMIFNGTGRISETTRNEVLKAGEELGYVHQRRNRKNPAAGESVAILLLIDQEWTFIWHFLSEMIQEIEQDLKKIGMRTNLIPISHHEDVDSIFDKITEFGSGAVYSVHYGDGELFRRLEEADIPVVVIMNNNYQDSYFSICIDDYQGAYEGTRHLISLGHEKIGFVDTMRADLPMLSSDRYYGYRKALEESGIRPPSSHRIGCEDQCSEEDLEERFSALFAGEDRPSALFCLDDEIAFRTWNALSRLGYSVPRDCSILAPGDVLDYTKPYIPQITTMKIDMTYVGRLAVDMLRNRLRNDIETIHVLKVKQQLSRRGSCRPVDRPA